MTAIIDLRTDFVSTPTDAMIEAMVRAARRPPAFGLRDDPAVAELESTAADMLGMEDALFCATCAAANQIAIHLHCRPGDAIVAEAGAHIITSEAGAHAALTGAVIRALPPHPAVPDDHTLAAAFAPAAAQRSRAALLWLENTHVGSGGTVLPPAQTRRMVAMARQAGASVHLDGSRLFNAANHLGVTAAVLTRDVDSVSVSLNKGLAAPLGAILAGTRSFVDEATRVRQMLGGGWRPAHIPAAAALVGLRTMVDRLGQDHANAQALARALVELPALRIDLAQVQTNIVFVGIDPTVVSAAALGQRLAGLGVLAHEIGQDRLRLVTWHAIGPAEVSRVVDAFATALRQL